VTHGGASFLKNLYRNAIIMISDRLIFPVFTMPDVAIRGMSPEIHSALKRAAELNHRSLNGEILARLEASMEKSIGDVEALLARVATRKARSKVPDLGSEDLRALKQAGRP
jgi:hypothetical protein